jgi:tRNA dimethylallyltransferase
MKRNPPKKSRSISASEQNNKLTVNPKQLSVKNKKLIVILGPTATGKTRLATKLTRLFNGEIISADSRQVYRGLDIGTGKDLKEYHQVPYFLIDIISPYKQFTLADYQKKAYAAIDDILKRGRTPFLVGGTGLYLQSIIDGYVLFEAKPDKKIRLALARKSLKELQNLVRKYSIKLNQSDFNNKRRLIRAIEIKQSKILFQPKNPKYQCLVLGLKYPKNILDERIDQRLEDRLKQGLVNEVRQLRKNGLSWKRLEDFGLEYKWVALFLQKKITYDEMADRLKIAIHQFAKRQMTWFKRMEKIIWLKNEKQAIKLIKTFLN